MANRVWIQISASYLDRVSRLRSKWLKGEPGHEEVGVANLRTQQVQINFQALFHRVKNAQENGGGRSTDSSLFLLQILARICRANTAHL